MTDLRLNNTIFLMFYIIENYKKVHKIDEKDFLELDKKYDIINYISECPDIFDSMTDDEMVKEIDDYVSQI